ncbi:MAG: CIA30 family protein [Verrucomicrobia bacterium]|nr:CIA30 family protein [Verrucomicrobiota bacterium]
MKTPSIPAVGKSLHTFLAVGFAGLLINLGPMAAESPKVPLLLDDYADARLNQFGQERILVNDASVGSRSQATPKCEKGVLSVKGDLVPGRGVPAFVSYVSLVAGEGKTKDLTGYTGVRLKVKVTQGILSVQVGTAGITNFDYHTSTPIVGKRGEFQEVRIPFKDMKRAWSEQTPLNAKSITSVNLVSFGLARDAFAYEVDEIGFY